MGVLMQIVLHDDGSAAVIDGAAASRFAAVDFVIKQRCAGAAGPDGWVRLKETDEVDFVVRCRRLGRPADARVKPGHDGAFCGGQGRGVLAHGDPRVKPGDDVSFLDGDDAA